MSAEFDLSFLAKWLASGALLGVSGERLLLGAGEARFSAKPTAGRPSFYAPDFFLTDPSPWISYEALAWVSPKTLLSALRECPSAQSTALKWSIPSRNGFEKVFQGLQSEFQAGHLEKGVPFTFEMAEGWMDAPRLASHLIAVLEYAQSRPVVPYGFWSGREGILGCTPEHLFQQKDGTIHTMALAGTRRHDDHGRPALLDDPKERREHQLVIDSIVAELSVFGKVEQHPTFEAQLPNLSHLKTLIDLKPQATVDFEALVEALHPTPALGAFPRQKGWQWLQRVEAEGEVKRARFGAPFGALWQDAGDQPKSLCVVAIRNVQWRDSRILLCAGAGVIAESELDREWLELQGKIRAVKGILSL